MPTNSANFSNRVKNYLGEYAKTFVSGGEILDSAYDADSGILYICGSFTSVNNGSVQYLAALDGQETLLPLSLSFNISGTTKVKSLTLKNGFLYFVGEFSSINGQQATGIGSVDLSTNTYVPWGPIFNNTSINSISKNGNNFMVIGSFTSGKDDASSPDTVLRGGTLLSDSGLIVSEVRLPAANSSTLGIELPETNSSLVLNPGRVGGSSFISMLSTDMTGHPNNIFEEHTFNGTVRDFAYDGSGFYVVGDFTEVDGQPRSRAAYINNDGTLHEWSPVFNRNVRCVEVTASYVLFGGEFSVVNSFTRNLVAAFSRSNKTLDAGFRPKIGGSRVNVIRYIGSEVFVGGSFGSIDSGLPTFAERNNAASFYLTGSLRPWNPNFNGEVFDIDSVYVSTVFVAGNFTKVGSNAQYAYQYFVHVDKSSGSIYSSFPNLKPNNECTGISSVIHHGVKRWYVTGNFSAVNSVTSYRYFSTDINGSLQSSGYTFEPSSQHNYDIAAYSKDSVLDVVVATDYIPTFTVSGLLFNNSNLSPTMTSNTGVAYKVKYLSELDAIVACGAFSNMGGESYSLVSINQSGAISENKVSGIGYEIRGGTVSGTEAYVYGTYNEYDVNKIHVIDLQTNLVSEYPLSFNNEINSVVIDEQSNVYVSGRFDAFSTRTDPLDIVRGSGVVGDYDLYNFGVFDLNGVIDDRSYLMNLFDASGGLNSVIMQPIDGGIAQVVPQSPEPGKNSIRVWDTRYNVPRN